MRKSIKSKTNALAVAAASVIAISSFKSASAAVISSWSNAGTDWATAGNWTPSGVPSATTGTASFDADHGTGTAINNPNLASESDTVNNLNIDNSFLGTGWTFTGSSTSQLSVGSATTAGPLFNLRGVQTTTINVGKLVVNAMVGTSGASSPGVIIGSDSVLNLTGNTVASVTEAGTSSSDSIQLRGGTLILDNSAGNPTAQRLTSGTANSAAISANGTNSTVIFKGASGGTSFTGLGGGALVANSGNFNVEVDQTGSTATTVNFAALTANNDDGGFIFSSIGNGTLGAGAGNPSITFTTAPNVDQGVIFNSKTTSTKNQYPLAIVTTTSGGIVSGTYATYGANGIAAATLTSESATAFPTLGTSQSAGNVNYISNATPNSTATLSGNVTVNTLTINPGSTGQTLDLGTHSINTASVLLSGGTNFSITDGTLFGTPQNDTDSNIFWVTNPTTTLSVSTPLFAAASANNLQMYGPGIVKLTGTANQVNTTGSIQISGGTLEGTTTNIPLSGTTPLIKLRGGVLEINSAAGGSTFSQALGVAAGNVNWATNAGPTSNTGSGGFSAVGGPLTVNLGGAAAKDTWGGQTGTDINFVQDGYALDFGSPDSNNTVIWKNPIGLDSGTAGAYAAREINVAQGTGVAADETNINAIISGSTSTDLIKNGNGTLELSAANTYQGNTMVMAGTLKVTGSIAENSSSNVLIATGATQATFGAVMSRSTAAGASYDGIGSRIIGDLSTRADILAGKNSNNNANGESITMQWRTRAVNETPGTSTSPPSDPTSFGLISDVVRITGMANTGTTGSGFTDPFALQMTYQAPSNETQLATLGDIRVDWLNPNGAGADVPEWQNAVLGDDSTGADAKTDVQSSLSAFLAANSVTDSNLNLYLGSWGVDVTTHTAWTIVDHNSDFAVVPEPGTAAALLLMGGLGALSQRRRRRSSMAGQ